MYSNGLYFAVEAAFTTNQRELYYQNAFDYTIIITHEIVPTANDKANPLFLDTGDVYTSVIPQNQYTFFRVPLHKGSITVAVSAPKYVKPVTPALDCRNYTVYGVQACTTQGCGWCVDKCVPCTGKIGDLVVCDVAKITVGCISSSVPPAAPVNPPTTATDFCSPFSARACASPNLAGICGWCTKSQSCGECSRTLIEGADRWCGGEIPRGCEAVRSVVKRSPTEVFAESYGEQKLQLVVSYNNAFLGPSCGCWKPDVILTVREGETIYYTIDSCRLTPTYVGVYGILPTPNTNTTWQCILGLTFPLRLWKGDVQCMSVDGVRCLSEGTCSDNLQYTDPATIVPLACGEQHRKIWGGTGYETPTHWCARGLTYFVNKARQYSEIPYTISVRESIHGKGIALRPLAVNNVVEGTIYEGETQNFQLQFPRTNLDKKVMIIRLVGHWQSQLQLDLGLLDGRTLSDTDSCYSINSLQRSCKLSSVNGGVCKIVWGQCEWLGRNDTRNFAVRVRRESYANATASILDPTNSMSLYNLEFELVSQEVRNLTLGSVVSETLIAGLYHHYSFEIVNTTRNQELVVEAYFDAGKELFLFLPLIWSRTSITSK